MLLNVNSFLLGSRRTNPQASLAGRLTTPRPRMSSWTWLRRDRVSPRRAAGCHRDGRGRGARTCGHAFDQAALAPKGYITGADYYWTDLFETFVETLQKGGTLPNFVTGGYDKDYVRSSPFGAGATPVAINAAKTAMQAMKNQDPIFVGPIKDNTGKTVVPAGTTYGPYADELQQTNYLIDGVIGSITDVSDPK